MRGTDFILGGHFPQIRPINLISYRPTLKAKEHRKKSEMFRMAEKRKRVSWHHSEGQTLTENKNESSIPLSLPRKIK